VAALNYIARQTDSLPLLAPQTQQGQGLFFLTSRANRRSKKNKFALQKHKLQANNLEETNILFTFAI